MTEPTTKKAALKVTGHLDTQTVKALQKMVAVKQGGTLDRPTVEAIQELAGVKVTGLVHGQNQTAENAGGSIDPTIWRYHGARAAGDEAARFFQDKLGLPTTGQYDTATVSAIQGAINGGAEWA